MGRATAFVVGGPPLPVGGSLLEGRKDLGPSCGGGEGAHADGRRSGHTGETVSAHVMSVGPPLSV